MGIFSKRNQAAEQQAFPRTILRQALTFRTWYEGVIVVHVEIAGSNYLKFNLIDWQESDQDNWVELEVDSSAEGDEHMRQLLKKPAYINTLFEVAEASRIDFKKVSGWTEKYGFSDFLASNTFESIMKMARGEKEYPADESVDTLSLGNFLSAQLEKKGFLPKSEEEVTIFWGYLNEPSMRVGLFGNYKHILKSLTQLFDEVVERGDKDVTSAFAGCLGSGFGQIEAYLSKGNVSPSHFLQRESPELLTLRYLPEFGGNAYPSLRTAQYLSRLGLRLLKRIDSECDSIARTRFRVNLLNVADSLEERQGKYLEYQLLVNQVIYGDLGLSRRDRTGRKLVLAEKEQRENYSVSADYIRSLGPAEVEVYGNWVANLTANSPAITQFAFDLAEQLKLEFQWSKKAIRSLAGTSSERIQTAVLREVKQNLSQFFNISPPDQPRYLRMLDADAIAKLFAIPNYSLGRLANEWAADSAQRELSAEDIQISKALLAGQRGRFFSSTLLSFLVNLAKYSQFDPFEEWKNLIGLKFHNVYWLSTAEFLSYIGADHSKPGVFDQLSNPPQELIAFFAKEVTAQLQWSTQETTNEVLGAILRAHSPALQSVCRLIIRKRLINEEKINGFLAFANDPNLPLALLGDLITEGDESAIVQQFHDLGAENQRVFWRKNAAEVEDLLKSWPGFPKFFWTAGEKLPQFVFETLSSYKWLFGKLQALITPSAIVKMTLVQSALFVEILKLDKAVLTSDSFLRAVLSAPSADINKFGVDYVKSKKRDSEFWLVMLESNLPVTSHAGYEYLESQAKSSNFADLLMMALDSNNKNARRLALGLLNKASNPKLLDQVIHKLAENRNSELWSVVRANLQSIKDGTAFKAFTRRVFLSRRQARAEKEKIKKELSRVVSSISDAMDEEILLRMTFSSVTKDREWALKQIALGNATPQDVIVEKTWGGSKVV